MSRIGKLPITIPSNVQVDLAKKPGVTLITVKGPKGELQMEAKDYVKVISENNSVKLEKTGESKSHKAYWGLYRTLIANMVKGVLEGYKKDLEIVGIGYRAEMQGNKLVLSLGYSHKINYIPPQNIEIAVADQTNLSVSGPDKQLVGEVAAKIRAFRKPEPYKGKGVRYKNEKVRRKSTKTASK